jgi:hypothetical protein
MFQPWSPLSKFQKGAPVTASIASLQLWQVATPEMTAQVPAQVVDEAA